MTERKRRRSPLERLYLLGVEGVTEVLLVRHAEQARDLSGKMGDLRDPPLSERGREQARLVGESLSATHLDAVFSSGLQRALNTAEAIAGHHELEVKVIEDLREHETFRDISDDHTALQALPRELLRGLNARLLAERSLDIYPYSEISYEFRQRAVNAVEQAIASQRAERIAIVCHSGVINIYVSHILKSPYDLIFGPNHTSISVVAAGDGRRIVRSLNDARHLETPDGDLRTTV
ncbi:MAG: histidine phosphatase family protein [Chloroflexi bacterium]|nr:histidine phosphatase family protein [Chloroflexota bacterium]